jgi:polysaccharide biosynthesis/export protein
MIKRLLFLLCICSFFCACTQFKDITYIRNIGTQNDTLYNLKFNEYKVQIADILYIRVTCLDDNINELFNKNSSQGNSSSMSSSTGGGFYLMGYTVDNEGNIALPIIGKVFVLDQTVNEIQTKIKKLSEKFITDASIDVKLVSFKISFLGEVRRAGQINIYSDRANIFEALSLAGDISYYGNRHNVLIMRAGKKGTEIHRVDLTDKNILTSDLFFLQPNDIVYVEPMRSTGFRLSAADYAVLMSTFAATISTIFLIKNLSK